MSFLSWQLYRLRWKHQAKFNMPKLLNLDLELSSACNLCCSFCYHGSKETVTWKPGYMSEHMAYRLLMQAKEYGVPAVKLNFRGEPTLNPHFNDIASFAMSLGFKHRIINTNLSFTNQRIINGLLACNEIIVSADGMGKRYEQIRKGAKWENFLINLDNLIYRNRKSKVVIRFVRTPDTLESDIDFYKNRYLDSVEINVRDAFPRGRDGLVPDLRGLKRRVCIYPFNRLVITNTGHALPCCADYREQYVLGNTQTNTIKEIFENEKMKKLRQRCFSLDYTSIPCSECRSYTSYKR